MRAIYSLSKEFTSTIEDPRVVGIIKESGGRMYMSEKRWDLALEDFFESFKSLVECGASNANELLKYVVLASILSNATVDYLGTREAKIFA